VTRLMQVRVEIENPDDRLRPEMLAAAEFATGAGIPAVLVPQEAIQQVNGRMLSLSAWPRIASEYRQCKRERICAARYASFRG
jgi:hypothetical protein